ncbi:uncharacterized protein [Blastocystis hominis]|uniref:RING-type domain-containing protein n=1 Tax=Blastocystis hominis TaxID=12968 RepID=D8LZ44_BLAHO|nr:uncharacterized protein [Blastocystis hominis]CBK21083.2 unnamed protein product [Blastocystis hominis]|eukprot:XP_012895131.1 uncharacterized protein [Blastocystis hominis]
MPETYYCHKCKRTVSATQQPDGSYQCSQCHDYFVEIRDEPDVPPVNNPPPQNINGNTFVFQPNIVRLPNGTVTMSFQTSSGHINMDHIGQLLSMILTGFDRPAPVQHTSRRFIRNLVHRHPTDAELESTPTCPICENDITKEDEIVSLPCNHLFHPNCIVPWIEDHNTCPTCRAQLPLSDGEEEG